MGKYQKLIIKILSGMADASVSFAELCNLLKVLDFEERTKGSHHVFRKEGVIEKINLQKEGSHAKPYQVKQVRSIILKYKLGGNSDAEI
jgi:predicted RNA binding protein YcfA (HicA-like mRNA interferase family)